MQDFCFLFLVALWRDAAKLKASGSPFLWSHAHPARRCLAQRGQTRFEGILHLLCNFHRHSRIIEELPAFRDCITDAGNDVLGLTGAQPTAIDTEPL